MGRGIGGGRWCWKFVRGVALAALYWWEVERLGLIQGQLGGARIVPPIGSLHWQFFSHAILFGLMLAASFIDIDEKIIPDAITVPGTLLGLLLATIVPMSLLPQRVGAAGTAAAKWCAGRGIDAPQWRTCQSVRTARAVVGAG